jgi:cysteinyl-tRNA synthetase
MLPKEQLHEKAAWELASKFEKAMEDDFNTADAIAAVFELVKLSNSTVSDDSSKAYIDFMKKLLEKLCDVLGIFTERKAEALDEEIEAMIAARQQARKAKNFALADAIRAELLEKGIILEDTREGVKWKRV